MKSFIKILTLVLVASFASCTHNNGDIGKLFGNWKITKIEAVDCDQSHNVYDCTANSDTNHFLAFQNSVCTTNTISENHKSHITYATWYETDNNIIIDFCDTSLPTSLIPGLKKHGKYIFTILKKTNKELHLQTTVEVEVEPGDMRGFTFDYHLKKW